MRQWLDVMSWWWVHKLYSKCHILQSPSLHVGHGMPLSPNGCPPVALDYSSHQPQLSHNCPGWWEWHSKTPEDCHFEEDWCKVWMARHPCHAQAISKAHVPMVPLTTGDVTWGAACIRTQRLCPLHHVSQGIMLLCFFFFLMRALSYIVRAALHAG